MCPATLPVPEVLTLVELLFARVILAAVDQVKCYIIAVHCIYDGVNVHQSALRRCSSKHRYFRACYFFVFVFFLSFILIHRETWKVSELAFAEEFRPFSCGLPKEEDTALHLLWPHFDPFPDTEYYTQSRKHICCSPSV